MVPACCQQPVHARTLEQVRVLEDGVLVADRAHLVLEHFLHNAFLPPHRHAFGQGTMRTHRDGTRPVGGRTSWMPVAMGVDEKEEHGDNKRTTTRYQLTAGENGQRALAGPRRRRKGWSEV